MTMIEELDYRLKKEKDHQSELRDFHEATPMTYFYWRKYGGNNHIQIECTESEYEKYNKSYPAKYEDKYMTGFYRRGKDGNDNWVDKKTVLPDCTYCGNTYWYAYVTTRVQQ